MRPRAGGAGDTNVSRAALTGRNAVFDPVAERNRSAHPDALPFRGGDLVADTLAGDLALELGERQQHVEGQSPHAGGRVEGLGHRDEGDAVRVEHFDQLCEVGKRPRRPVDLVDDEQLAAGQQVTRAARVECRRRSPRRVPLPDVAGEHRVGGVPGLLPRPLERRNTCPSCAVAKPTRRLWPKYPVGSNPRLRFKKKRSGFPFERERVCVCVAVRESCGVACETLAADDRSGPGLASVRGRDRPAPETRGSKHVHQTQRQAACAAERCIAAR